MSISASNQQLVEAIERRIGYQLASAVRHAFLMVDRRQFVPSCYVQRGLQWEVQQIDAEAYEDQALIVHLDEYGRPDSSSSQPSLMAQMMEPLDVQPGLHVLEVGTGTGYNAAIIGQMVGPTGAVYFCGYCC